MKSRHWRPSRARVVEGVDLTAGKALTKADVESLSSLSAVEFWFSFWARIATASLDECWNWQGAVNDYGYGYLKIGPTGERVQLLAHRVAFAAYNDELPDGADLLHSCDNPPCCNPAHLRIGDQRTNLADMRAKGRAVLPPNARRVGGAR